MNKPLFSITIASILASVSISVSAGTVSIPNTFTAGTPAVASEMNANFIAFEAAVDDNAADIASNTGNITTNTGAIATNTADISTNTADTATNAGNISTNTTAIATNTAAITALQSASTCPSDMVAVGSLCVDKYEASLWDAATGGTQLTEDPLGPPYWPCNEDGSDCGDGLVGAIYARSVSTVTPAGRVTWYQAAQACANVGKRLPTTAEWVMAASGTPAGTTDCNSPAAPGSVAATGSFPLCVSTADVNDMVGNLWEWTAELDTPAVAPGTTLDDLVARVLGESFNNTTGTPSSKSLFLPTSRALATNSEFGFRCVR